MNAPVQFDDPKTLTWWTNALQGKRGPITADEPMTGYYRARSKNKQTGAETLFAVTYWWHNGKCFCKVNPPGAVGVQPTLQGEKHDRMMAAWPHVSKEPIRYDVYKAVAEDGKPWPDQHVVEAAPAEASNQPLDAQGNAPPAAGAADPIDDSPQGKLKRELATAVKGVARYVRITPDKKTEYLIDSDEMSGAAQSLRSVLLAVGRKAEKARKDANAPFQEEIRKNGAIWSPIEDEATRMANWLRDGPMKQWEMDKRAQVATAQTAAQAASEASGQAVAPKSNAPAPSASIKGATGRSARVEETAKAVINDWGAVYEHFKDNEQVKAILQGLANAAVRAGIEVPGTTKDKDVKIT